MTRRRNCAASRWPTPKIQAKARKDIFYLRDVLIVYIFVFHHHSNIKRKSFVSSWLCDDGHYIIALLFFLYWGIVFIRDKGLQPETPHPALSPKGG
jgi:hypothetical protein